MQHTRGAASIGRHRKPAFLPSSSSPSTSIFFWILKLDRPALLAATERDALTRAHAFDYLGQALEMGSITHVVMCLKAFPDAFHVSLDVSYAFSYTSHVFPDAFHAI